MSGSLSAGVAWRSRWLTFEVVGVVGENIANQSLGVVAVQRGGVNTDIHFASTSNCLVSPFSCIAEF